MIGKWLPRNQTEWYENGIYDSNVSKVLLSQGHDPAQIFEFLKDRKFEIGYANLKAEVRVGKEVDVYAVYAAVSEFPYPFRRPVKIEFKGTTIRNALGTAWIYQRVPKLEVYAFKHETISHIEQTFVHEVGHYHDARFLSYADRKALLEIMGAKTWLGHWERWENRGGEYYADLFRDYWLGTNEASYRHSGLAVVTATELVDQFGEHIFLPTRMLDRKKTMLAYFRQRFFG